MDEGISSGGADRTEVGEVHARSPSNPPGEEAVGHAGMERPRPGVGPATPEDEIGSTGEHRDVPALERARQLRVAGDLQPAQRRMVVPVGVVRELSPLRNRESLVRAQYINVLTGYTADA